MRSDVGCHNIYFFLDAVVFSLFYFFVSIGAAVVVFFIAFYTMKHFISFQLEHAHNRISIERKSTTNFVCLHPTKAHRFYWFRMVLSLLSIVRQRSLTMKMVKRDKNELDSCILAFPHRLFSAIQAHDSIAWSANFGWMLWFLNLMFTQINSILESISTSGHFENCNCRRKRAE